MANFFCLCRFFCALYVAQHEKNFIQFVAIAQKRRKEKFFRVIMNLLCICVMHHWWHLHLQAWMRRSSTKSGWDSLVDEIIADHKDEYRKRIIASFNFPFDCKLDWNAFFWAINLFFIIFVYVWSLTNDIHVSVSPLFKVNWIFFNYNVMCAQVSHRK